MSNRALIGSMLAAAIAAPTIALAIPANGPVASPKFTAEKCYGVAKAGENDCGATGNNSCAGTSKVSGDPKAWIYVATGYCDRIVGGSKTPKA